MDRMRFVELEEHAALVCVRLVRGRGNALEATGLAEIESVFRGLAASSSPPVILAARGRSFCTGLDLIASAESDRGDMHRLMTAFHRALAAVFTYPGPVVAAISGHALAGGALLALCADRRIMAQRSGRFGVHGVGLGVAYPDVAIEVVRHQLDAREAERLLYEGRILTDAEALERGWIDQRTEPEQLEARAQGWLELMDGAPFRSAKRLQRLSAARRLSEIGEEGMARWLDQWFDPPTRTALESARVRLAARGTAPETSWNTAPDAPEGD